MAKPKYQQYVDQMFALHREQFQQFMLLCQDYLSDREQYAEEFNRQGRAVKEILDEWEAKLCGRMERGKYALYSSTLSDKYWDEVRKYFPCIDEVGVKISRAK